MSSKANEAVAAANAADGIPEQELTVREQLKSMTAAEFEAAHKKDALIAIATEFGVEDTSGTKAELVAKIVAAADLPDPSLRGKSTVESPVARVWDIADRMKAENPEVRRKDVIAACQAEGVAFYTARTQYQSWFTATDKGTKRLEDIDPKDLPAELRPAPEPETQEADA